jgi:hypothetical protein
MTVLPTLVESRATGRVSSLPAGKSALRAGSEVSEGAMLSTALIRERPGDNQRSVSPAEGRAGRAWSLRAIPNIRIWSAADTQKVDSLPPIFAGAPSTDDSSPAGSPSVTRITWEVSPGRPSVSAARTGLEAADPEHCTLTARPGGEALPNVFSLLSSPEFSPGPRLWMLRAAITHEAEVYVERLCGISRGVGCGTLLLYFQPGCSNFASDQWS